MNGLLGDPANSPGGGGLLDQRSPFSWNHRMQGGLLGRGWDDPRTYATMQAALQLLGGPGSSMQRLAGALNNYGRHMHGFNVSEKREQAEHRRRELEDQSRQQQMEMQQAQIKAFLRAQDRDQGVQEAIRRAYIPPQQQALAAGGGPTRANAARIPQMTGFDQRALIQGLLGADPLQALQMAQPKERKLQKLGPNESLVDTADPTRALFTAPDKPAALPSAVQEYQFAQQDGFKGSFEQWKRLQRPAGTVVNVGEGQKGLDNTLKLRNDWRQETAYKNFQEIDGAFKQIQASLSQESPVGDMAAATKIMKVLDPTSVVRESELAMAMAASGRMDRLQNYLSMWASGQKLTPQQRTDFGALAGEFHKAAAEAYNNKRAEYQKIGDEFGLNSNLSLGAPAGPAKVIDWGSLK